RRRPCRDALRLHPGRLGHHVPRQCAERRWIADPGGAALHLQAARRPGAASNRGRRDRRAGERRIVRSGLVARWHRVPVCPPAHRPRPCPHGGRSNTKTIREDKMKRRDLLIGSAALAVSGPARGAEPTTISLWHIYAREFDMIHLGIKLFNEANNGYRIEPR